MTIHTLEKWVDLLLSGERTIECPYMEILGDDFEPPVFTGVGQISIGADRNIYFVMHAIPRDGSEAFRKIVDAQNNPYDTLRQFRVNAMDYSGIHWSGGWTRLQIGGEANNTWRLTGVITSLHTRVIGSGVAERQGVELVYDKTLRLPIPMNMVRSVKRGDEEVLWSCSAGTHTVQVLDAKIEFFQSAEYEHLWVVAETTPQFPHPHFENWISEPLNLLLGEIVSPSLYARNFGDGTASVVFRPASGYRANAYVGCILRKNPRVDSGRFWSLYRDILTVVAKARDTNGQKNFEAHPITRYYWEIIQASKGSNWVQCMTLASTVEGIVKLMVSESEQRSDHDDSLLESLKNHLNFWDKDNDLRSRVLNYVGGFKSKGINNILRSLVGNKGITIEQVNSWIRLRNASMHGEMVLPWPDKEQDMRISNLVELVHRVCEIYIERELENLSSAVH